MVLSDFYICSVIGLDDGVDCDVVDQEGRVQLPAFFFLISWSSDRGIHVVDRISRKTGNYVFPETTNTTLFLTTGVELQPEGGQHRHQATHRASGRLHAARFHHHTLRTKRRS